MSNFLTMIYILICMGLGSLASCTQKEMPAEMPDSEILILVSIDGFRYDYHTLTQTPALDRINSNGASAESLIPVFPSKTFPNHYSQVTGLYPEHHGIVQNTMYDPVFNETFRIGAGSATAQDGKWYEGEPIWVTVEKQGKKAATFFWPGSDAAIQGIRPTYYRVFDNTVASRDRVDQVLDWLSMPNGERPDFISLYFEHVDMAGHKGPASDETLAQVRIVDGHLNRLLEGIDALELTDHVNMIVVSDHGMSPLSRDRVIFLDDYINLDDVEIINWGPVSNLIPAEGKEDAILNALTGAHPNYQAFRKGNVPTELHYNNHRRITPITGIADDGWSVTSRDYFNDRPNAFTGGNHGYAPSNQSMHGILMATGPSIKRGVEIAPVECIHLYALMCKILDLQPAPNDGDLKVIAGMLQ